MVNGGVQTRPRQTPRPAHLMAALRRLRPSLFPHPAQTMARAAVEVVGVATTAAPIKAPRISMKSGAISTVSSVACLAVTSLALRAINLIGIATTGVATMAAEAEAISSLI